MHYYFVSDLLAPVIKVPCLWNPVIKTISRATVCFSLKQLLKHVHFFQL